MANSELNPLTNDQRVRLAAVLIREAIKKGPDAARLSTTERYMVAFATCDRQTWLPQSSAKSSELWQRLDDVQRAAVLISLNKPD